MSIKVKTAYGTPRYFRDIIEVSGGWAEMDAVPFYTGIRLKNSASGVRTKTVGTITTEESVDYSVEETYARIPTEWDAGAGFWQVWDQTIGVDCAWGVAAAVKPPPAGSCHIRVRINGDGSYLSVGIFATPPVRSPQKIGVHTVTDTETNPPTVTRTDMTGTITTRVPTFWSESAAGTRNRDSHWGFSGHPFDVTYPDGGIDISGWSIAQWRDLRGVFVQSGPERRGIWDTNTIIHSYEWEIF